VPSISWHDRGFHFCPIGVEWADFRHSSTEVRLKKKLPPIFNGSLAKKISRHFSSVEQIEHDPDSIITARSFKLPSCSPNPLKIPGIVGA
jgi:hypothetical protein